MMITKTADVRVKIWGIFYPETKPGDFVIRDRNSERSGARRGDVVEEIISPLDLDHPDLLLAQGQEHRRLLQILRSLNRFSSFMRS